MTENNYVIVDGELYHYGTLGMKWGKRKNYYGQSGDKYRASNGVTVGAPKNARVAAFRKVQGSKVGGAALKGMVKVNTAVYGRGKNKATWQNIEKQARKETDAVREANQAHKQAIKKAYGNITKSESIGSRMSYNSATYRKAAKNMVNKGMDQKTAVSKAKATALKNTGLVVAGTFLYQNKDKLIGGVKKTGRAATEVYLRKHGSLGVTWLD